MPGEPRAVRVLDTCAEPDCLDQVHELLEQLWEDAPEIPAEHRMRFELAVAEVTANIVRHACGERSGNEVALELRLLLFQDRLEAQFRDTGQAAEVDVEAVQMPDELADQGRGLAMARVAADQVAYQRDGEVNRWLVVKRCA